MLYSLAYMYIRLLQWLKHLSILTQTCEIANLNIKYISCIGIFDGGQHIIESCCNIMKCPRTIHPQFESASCVIVLYKSAQTCAYSGGIAQPINCCTAAFDLLVGKVIFFAYIKQRKHNQSIKIRVSFISSTYTIVPISPSYQEFFSNTYMYYRLEKLLHFLFSFFFFFI